MFSLFSHNISDNLPTTNANRNIFSPSRSNNDRISSPTIDRKENYKPRSSTEALSDTMQATNNIVIHHGKSNIRRRSLEEAYKTFRSTHSNTNSNTHSITTTPNNNSSVYIINTTEDPIWVPQKAQPQHPPSDCHVGGRSSCGESTTSATTVTATVTSGRSSVTPRKHRLHNNLDMNSSVPSSPSKNESFLNNKNISTSKLIQADDQSSTQTKCSIFRGLILCICLNLTYANVVRFPRELDKNGMEFLIPYLILLLLVGLPIVLLEISIGQFLGQGAAHTWRSSPIFKGACIVSRLASCLASIWISLQAVLGVVYIGMFIYKPPPFNDCVGDIKIVDDGYKVMGKNGEDCIKMSILMPLWENPMYFGLITLGLIFLWIIVMLCTHNAKIIRRTTFFLGFIGFILLLITNGWEVHNAVKTDYFPTPSRNSFEMLPLTTSAIWFNALVQVIYSTSIGFGILPVLTGKFLYKGDAVRTSIIFICFNLLICALAVVVFVIQFDEVNVDIYELKPVIAIYDRIVRAENTSVIRNSIACLLYALIALTGLVSVSIIIYTASRLMPRHPNYLVSLLGLVFSVGAIVVPQFQVPKTLDTRVVGTLIITAMIFELIATTWIYGARNIYTDLEFSIGRPVWKSWMSFWCATPVILTGILVWWCVGDESEDVLGDYLPRWAPIVFVLVIVFLVACVEVYKQVDYNFFGMICEAAKSAKEWGPADPLARHAWKQWRSVCQDTGRKDFTLRRRGTRDYTHSIKKGQYSTANMSNSAASKYGPNWKSTSITPGSNSPNYSGSVFGDSAIEEDMSVDKYSGIGHIKYSSNRSRQTDKRSSAGSNGVSHKEIVYVGSSNNAVPQVTGSHATRIEITPSNESIVYSSQNPTSSGYDVGIHRTSTLSNDYRSQNSSIPLTSQTSRMSEISYLSKNSIGNLSSNSSQQYPNYENCWKKYPVNTEEYSTEL
ncbi:hypothetical protein ACFFRR_010758 [Megaselia abdita]